MFAGVVLFAVLISGPPQEPLRVHVYAAPRGEPWILETIEHATHELQSNIRGDAEWFRYTEDREQAEIVVYVEALTVGGRVGQEARTSRMGAASHTTNFPFATDAFELQAVAEILGRSEVLSGRSETSETRAASALFGELRAYVEQHYAELEKRRILFRYWAQHPEQIELARALCNDVRESSKKRDLPVVSVRWSGSTLVVTLPRTTSRFPFTPSRLETCIPDANCRRTVVNQVVGTLSR